MCAAASVQNQNQKLTFPTLIRPVSPPPIHIVFTYVSLLLFDSVVPSAQSSRLYIRWTLPQPADKTSGFASSPRHAFVILKAHL